MKYPEQAILYYPANYLKLPKVRRNLSLFQVAGAMLLQAAEWAASTFRRNTPVDLFLPLLSI